MSTTHYQITVVGNRRNLVRLEEVAGHVGLHPDLVRRFTEFGLLEPVEVAGTTILFDPEAIHRIEVIQRLRCDLGINLAGIGVILELLDRFKPRP